jgi:hypothetical protein
MAHRLEEQNLIRLPRPTTGPAIAQVGLTEQ